MSSAEIDRLRADAQRAARDRAEGLRIESLPPDWSSKPPAPRQHVIMRFYPVGCASAVVSTGGGGKSTLLSEQAGHVAAGVPWRGFDVLPGGVAIVTWEDSPEDYAAKFYGAVRGHLDLRPHVAAITRNVHFVRLRGSGKHLVRAEGGKPVVTELARELIELLSGVPDLRWVIFETASRANAADEMNEGMARLVEALEIVAVALNVAATISHHTSKAAVRSDEIDATAGRGGSALADNCRSTVVMLALDENSPAGLLPPGLAGPDLKDRDIVLVEHARSSYARKAPRLWLERRYLPEGLPYFAPVERPSAAAQDARERGLLDAVAELIANADRDGRPVTGATSGPLQTYHAMEVMPGFPNALRGPGGTKALRRLVEQLKASGRIVEDFTPGPDRKMRKVLRPHAGVVVPTTTPAVRELVEGGVGETLPHATPATAHNSRTQLPQSTVMR